MIYHQQHKTSMMEQYDERLAKRMLLRWLRQKRKLLKYLEDNPRTTKTIVSALPIMPKHAGYFAMLPVNLDLQAHLQRYPLTDYMFVNDNGHIRTVNTEGTFGSYFDHERMIHILGLITSGRADKKDEIDESGYVPIHSKRIRNYFKDYLSYLHYLERTGIVICDGYYIIEEKPYRLKLAPEYDNVPLSPYYYSYFELSDVNSVEEKVFSERTNSFEWNTLLKMPYLNHWYNQRKIEINPSAEEYAFDIMSIKESLGSHYWDVSNVWDTVHHCFKRKNPRTQYKAIIQNINEVKIHHYKAKIDSNVHRLHSVLTNMQKDFRNFLTYDGGTQLVSVDIKNSQPYLFCLLLNRKFWDGNSSLPININNQPLNIQELFTASPELLPTIRGFFESINEANIQEFQEYISLVAGGNLYEMIVTRAIQLRSTSKITRQKAKIGLLTLFYSPNKDDVEGTTRRVYIVSLRKLYKALINNFIYYKLLLNLF